MLQKIRDVIPCPRSPQKSGFESSQGKKNGEEVTNCVYMSMAARLEDPWSAGSDNFGETHLGCKARARH